MSPNTVMATVRGIGVAVITRTCGGCFPLPRNASRCSTPKRCCSSTTTSPRSKNWTCSWIRACVPMTMPASPDAASSRDLRRMPVGWLPVSSVTRVPISLPPSRPRSARSPSIEVIDRKCCEARTSVGASSAACPPESITDNIARSATTVLPDPTSPWSKRFMGCSLARSLAISAATSCWPAVSLNGIRASKASSRPPARDGRGAVRRASPAIRRCARTV